MPEIKNIFNEGKMDKDLDERLVANGQYRDAMNIQVSTSDASDIGTITNILGNLDIFPHIPMYSNHSLPTRSSQLSPSAKCVGCVVDDKNDCFYWFVYHSTKSLILKYEVSGGVSFVFVDVTNNVLQFSSKIITGINIIDDYLFWTDGSTEPKKIDVKLSQQGTHQGGHYNTRIVVPKRGINFNTNFVATREHVTVIKKAPKSKLVVEPMYSVDTSATSPSDIPGEIGDTGLITFQNFLPSYNSFKEGQVVKLLDQNSPNNINDSHDIRIEILEDLGEFSIFTTTIHIWRYKILAKRDPLATLGVQWNAKLEEDDTEIFPRKFIRFGYRYKYQGGEYSTFSPFTDNIFKPGFFDYSPKKAHNAAMENNLTSVKLRNFIAKEMPLDVVQIDILYTESDSPIIYIVDKIKYSDTPNLYVGQTHSGVGPSQPILKLNNWEANLYEITADLIYAAVPENQLVRNYDSVPINALAQEVTGNRIIYGNYEQNYNIETKPILLADIETRFTNNKYHENRYYGNYTSDRISGGRNPIPTYNAVIPGIGQKSLKTIRDYQLGVTYLDEYGRETPIFSSEESQFKVKKKFADNKLKIKGRVTTQPPNWAESMKIYVKETSTEYYNLALSRVYRAEDGDLWLAFPSSERNKVTEDSFLILKKAVDSTSLIESEAKYNILAIENEAPEYIKEQITELVALAVDSAGTANRGHELHGANYPNVDSRYFDINQTVYSSQFGGPKHLNIIEENIYVAFKNQEGSFSSRYKVTHVGGGYDVIAEVTTDYTVTLDKTFTVSDANFIFPNYPSTENSLGEVSIADGMQIIFYTGVVENKPEFKGVFFVKINSDNVAEQEIVAGYDTITTYEVLETAQAYYLSDYDATNPYSSTTIASNSIIDATNVLYSLRPPLYTYSSWESSPSHSATNSFEEWNEFHHWGQNATNPNAIFQGATPGPVGGFFIDKACYVATHPAGETNNDEWDYANAGNNPNHVLASHVHGNYLLADADPDDALTPPKFGRGIYEENGTWYMELSFTMCGDNADPLGLRGYKGQYDTDILWNDCNKAKIWEPENSALNKSQYQTIYGGDSDGLATVIDKIRSGQYFKFQNQTTSTAFRINGVTKQKRYNYLPPVSLDFSHLQFNVDVAFLNNDDANNGWSGGISGNVVGIGMTGGFKQAYERFVSPQNRRITYILELGSQDMSNIEISTGGQNTTPLLNLIDADSSVAIQFVDVKIPYETTTRNIISNNPAIFETEPVKTADLDIYYEATDSLPLIITQKNVQRFIPNAAVITCPDRPGVMNPTEIDYVVSTNGNLITAAHQLDFVAMLGPSSSALEPVRLRFTREDDSYTTAFPDVNRTIEDQISGIIQPDQFYIESNVSKNPFALSWFNCFTFNNGVESNRIRDTFNEVVLDKGVKANSITDSVYEREKRKNGLIFSGIYNSNAGVNNLNQFIAAEGITKDLNPTYGSIQKLFQRKDDLIAFCEDKVIRIKANKDTLFNADGSSNVVATSKVLGDSSPFAGDYGISKNPESFSKDNYRLYFADKQRGAILRLSMDGITPISEYGMSTFFKSKLGVNNILGTYDSNKDEYNLTNLPSLGTVSYKESVRGWSSFKSFYPDHGLSLSNNYYTFKNGIPYKHHVQNVERNTFYGVYAPSSITLLLNNEPSIIKSFKTLGYEGSQSKVQQEISTVESGYYNIAQKDGWYSDLIQTDKQKGSVNEFIEKEGKWFNNIKSWKKDDNRGVLLNTDEFQFQGIGMSNGFSVDPRLDAPVYGCMIPNATNYDPLATISDASCIFTNPPNPTVIGGCMDPLAPNFDSTATFDDGSCIYQPPTIVYGCTIQGSFNYDPDATVDDGSCQPTISGCLDPAALNYYPGANTDDGSCLYHFNYGCTDPQALNYSPTATIDDGSCDYTNQPILGCTDVNANNYDPAATLDDGSCTYNTGCTDPNATNYDPNATIDDGGCIYPPVSGCTDPLATNYDPLATVDDGSCTYPPPPPINTFALFDLNDDD